jgi:glutamate/tyrosine decarboxylase-like PLP-dependent enzyme
MLFELVKNHVELEAVSQNLSITTFRYHPEQLDLTETYLNSLNETLLDNLQKGGEVFLSNAVVREKYCLRACIVNFRTTEKDINEVVEIIVKEGSRIHDLLFEKI